MAPCSCGETHTSSLPTDSRFRLVELEDLSHTARITAPPSPRGRTQRSPAHRQRRRAHAPAERRAGGAAAGRRVVPPPAPRGVALPDQSLRHRGHQLRRDRDLLRHPRPGVRGEVSPDKARAQRIFRRLFVPYFLLWFAHCVYALEQTLSIDDISFALGKFQCVSPFFQQRFTNRRSSCSRQSHSVHVRYTSQTWLLRQGNGETNDSCPSARSVYNLTDRLCVVVEGHERETRAGDIRHAERFHVRQRHLRRH